MPIFNAPLKEIDPKETRRYAGLMRAKDFGEDKIIAACETALLFAEGRSIWRIYDYDADRGSVLAEENFTLEGEKILKHLSGCEKVILLAATVGKAIEAEIARLFEAGEYTASLLLDAAATTAVEAVADGAEKSMADYKGREGYNSRFRFSPGYGDWPLTAQTQMLRLTEAEIIGITLSSSLMLIPRKSITAIIGLYRGILPCENKKGCAGCNKTDCHYSLRKH